MPDEPSRPEQAKLDRRAAGAAARALLGELLRPHVGRTAALGVALAASSLLPLLGPQLLRSFVDDAIAGAPLVALTRIALAYVAVGVISEGVAVASAYIAATLAWRTTNDLRARLAGHALRLDLAQHGATTPGELVERVDGDVTAIATTLSSFTLRVVGGLLTLLGVLVAVAFEDVRVAAALLAVAVVGVAVLHRLRDAAVPQSAEDAAARAQILGGIEETLTAAEDLRANGGSPFALRRWHRDAARGYHVGVRAEMAGIRVWEAMTGLNGIAGAAALGIGTLLHARGSLTVGTVYLLFLYSQRMRRPLEVLSDEVRELQHAAGASVRITDLLATKPVISDEGSDGIALPPSGALSVQLDDVSFRYQDDEPVLHSVALDIEAGSVVGLVGRTGSGKTTLARLLLRLVVPSSGVVRVGGVDLSEAKLSSVRERIALVSQDVQIFAATVRENVTLFGCAGASDERIVAVLRDLGLGSWFDALPRGLDTLIGPGGSGTSAGEAQLLAFARAFLRDPGLVVLDEASSRLDPATEALVERAVDRLLAGRTAVIVAHRLATLTRADRVVVLDGGRVVEDGSPSQLAADPSSRWARLLAAGTADPPPAHAAAGEEAR